ncbi:MAG: YidC/Oxa1 family membrane protein insertase [bacterium]|nr:YidC/Oxa1 family membrane protein insertase [bacterium]
MKAFFVAAVYGPLYNGLVLLISILPGGNAGFAVIIFTLIIKLALFPLSTKATRTQLKMREMESGMNVIKEKYKNNKEEQARAIMSFYKENGINPFSGLLLVLIQIPILLSLYFMFFRGLPVLQEHLLYSFVPVSEVGMHFLGIFDLSQSSFILAFLAALTQYFQIRLAMPLPSQNGSAKGDFKQDLAKSLNSQMRIMMPILIFVILYPFPPFSRIFPTIPSVIALYWITSNLFAIGQELYMRNKVKAEKQQKDSQQKISGKVAYGGK